MLLSERDLDLEREPLVTIPGISATGAMDILAETSADMSCFGTPAHLASWAGVWPGQHESVGKTKYVRSWSGNAHLKDALGLSVIAAARTNGSFFPRCYKGLADHRGPARSSRSSTP